MAKRMHYVSGVIILLFIAVHLFNHILVFAGDETHMAFMKAARVVYRNSFVEMILLGCVVVQLVSGISLVVKKWNSQNSILDRFQLFSGLFLFYFLIAHTAAVFYCRLVLKLDSNLYFGASGLNNNPVYLYFIFHYGFAIIAVFVHVGCVHHKKTMRIMGLRQRNIQTIAIMMTGVMLATIILYRMMHVTIPMDYRFPVGRY